MILHAGLIARFDPSGWRGVLIEGSSGAGKSDLALRALDAGWALVADDRTLIWACGGSLYGRAADALHGLLEVRGLGVLPNSARAFAKIGLIAACAPTQAIDRLPERETKTLLGIDIPRIKLAAKQASAPSKLAYALTHVGLRR